MDEEKTIDEEKTVDEVVEEQADEMKEFEPVAIEDAIKDEPVKESAPVLRAVGDSDPADMNMIHKHLDNFLAKIAGETPIDENVRDSTEYWLNRIAESGGGGASVNLYMHIVSNSNSEFTLCILNTTNEPFTKETLATFLYNNGLKGTYYYEVYPANFCYFGSQYVLGFGLASVDGNALKLYYYNSASAIGSTPMSKNITDITDMVISM